MKLAISPKCRNMKINECVSYEIWIAYEQVLHINSSTWHFMIRKLTSCFFFTFHNDQTKICAFNGTRTLNTISSQATSFTGGNESTFILHHANTSVLFRPPYTPHLYSKTEVYKGILFSFYFALKHRLWVLFRTASLRQF